MCVPVHALALSCFSHVQLCATLGTVARQAPLSMGFYIVKNTGVAVHGQDLPDPGIKPASPMSPASASGFFTTEPRVVVVHSLTRL